MIFNFITSGIALLYMRLAALFPEQKSQYITKAKSLIDLALRTLDGKSFKCSVNSIPMFE